LIGRLLHEMNHPASAQAAISMRAAACYFARPVASGDFRTG
jgi:hypothetical protein